MMRIQSASSLPALLTLSILAALPNPVAEAAPLELPEAQELLILLRADAEVSPEQVVQAFQAAGSQSIRESLDTPINARYLVRRRVQQRAMEVMRRYPEGPMARLQRYVVLTYPADTDLELVREQLRGLSWIEGSWLSARFRLHVDPSDPLFPQTADPTTYQWGSHVLNLPEAWDLQKGHAVVGIIDTGIYVDHPDLRPFHQSGGDWVFDGGTFRPHLSWDFTDSTSCEQGSPSCVDELEVEYVYPTQCVPAPAGHGTHVAGIIGATADNGLGVAGACWDCSLIIELSLNNNIFEVPEAIEWLVRNGGQVLNMSWGNDDAEPTTEMDDAFNFAVARDLAMVASAGNDLADVEFPARDPRVISVGGIQPGAAPGTYSFWHHSVCPSELAPLITCYNAAGQPIPWYPPGNVECGSNHTVTPGSPMLELAAPASDVLSTTYPGHDWLIPVGCGDSTHPSSGFGRCTGTSMSAPYVTGMVALIRSTNPLLSVANVRQLLIDHASGQGTWDSQLGYGVPDAGASTAAAMGSSGGQVLANRLTPLFAAFSTGSQAHMYTIIPQRMAGALLDDDPMFDSESVGTEPIPGYESFPGVPPCQVSPCDDVLPQASVYIFTSDKAPFPGGPALVPLYRMSFEGTWGGNPDNRSFFYTINDLGLTRGKDDGYELDGLEGYILERCTPEPSCYPAGAVRLYRLYNSTIDDYVLVPESQVGSWPGYAPIPNALDYLGYAFPNVDTDGDDLIDGFESLAGTDPAVADSDCDGIGDGDEVLGFPYSDPIDGTCQVAMGETGKVTVGDSPVEVPLTRSYSSPVVFAQPVSYQGGEPSVVRIIDVQADRFTLYVQEAPNLNGQHIGESIFYAVFEAGSWRLADGALVEIGTVSTTATVGKNVANVWQAIGFSSAFVTSPIVLSQVQSDSDPHWVKTRQLSSTPSSVQLAMEEDEAGTTSHGLETIGWLAIDAGDGDWGTIRSVAGQFNGVTDAWVTKSFVGSFSAPPVFLAGLGTYAGGDNAAVRYTGLGVASVGLKVQEDTTFDAETSHFSGEGVGYLAFEDAGTLSASPD